MQTEHASSTLYGDDEITAVELPPRNLDRRIDARRARIAARIEERRRSSRPVALGAFERRHGQAGEPRHGAQSPEIGWDIAIAHAIVLPDPRFGGARLDAAA